MKEQMVHFIRDCDLHGVAQLTPMVGFDLLLV